MAISYKKLFTLLEKMGLNKNYLRKNGFHANTVDRLIKNQSVNTDIINRLCTLLDCQPGDIMEYIKEDE